MSETNKILNEFKRVNLNYKNMDILSKEYGDNYQKRIRTLKVNKA